jgi:hypothetical protein
MLTEPRLAGATGLAGVTSRGLPATENAARRPDCDEAAPRWLSIASPIEPNPKTQRLSDE